MKDGVVVMKSMEARASLPLALAVSGLFLVACGSPARAQSPEDMPVKQRPHPEYDPVGIRSGNVFFFPSIGVTETFNDNVLATRNDKVSDFITVLSPMLAVRSDGTEGGWQAKLDARTGLHARRHHENYTDASASLGGHYDVVPDGTLRLGGGYARLHEDRSSPDAVNGLDPTVYYRANASLGYSQGFNRLTARINLRARDFAYDNVTSPSGTTIDNGDRDRLDTEEELRLSYDVMPGYAVFTRGVLSQRNYRRSRDRNGIDRNSTGYRVDGGLSINLTGLLTLELSTGYLARDYSDPSLQSVSGVDAGARAIWNVTRMTTVTASLDRAVAETTLNGASGRFDTTGKIEVDHELLRNLILSGQVEYGRSAFQGISRRDNNLHAKLSADYLIAQGVKLSASAGHAQRSSNAAGADYARNIFMLELHYGL